MEFGVGIWFLALGTYCYQMGYHLICFVMFEKMTPLPLLRSPVYVNVDAGVDRDRGTHTDADGSL